MAENSAIAWTNHTANFWLGCQKVSPGCTNCYAETLTTNRMGLNVWGPDSARQEVKGIWANLRKWDREGRASGVPLKVFVMSLGDIMEDHPTANSLRPRVYDAMRETTHLIFQFLTKRPENYARFLPDDWETHPVWRQAWLGTSVENDKFTSRIDILRTVPVPSGVRWLSIEPLLSDLPSLDLTGIAWTVVGGESGAGFRSMDHAWARNVRNRSVLRSLRAMGADLTLAQIEQWTPAQFESVFAACAHPVSPRLTSGAVLFDELDQTEFADTLDVERQTAFFMKQSSAYRTEMGTHLIEADGSKWAWKQYPGRLVPPVRIAELVPPTRTVKSIPIVQLERDASEVTLKLKGLP